jgi:hypothetical protein
MDSAPRSPRSRNTLWLRRSSFLQPSTKKHSSIGPLLVAVALIGLIANWGW